MITVYSSNETTFTHNGLGTLLPTICEVTEEKNGLFELEVEHPQDNLGKWQNIIEANIIKAPTPRGDQLFRIYRKVPSMTGIKAYARHIFYDLLDNFLEDVRPTNLAGAGALNWILTHTQYSHGFTSMSDISISNSASYVRKNPVQAIMSDDENSFLNRWGGEVVRDNFTISILQAAGADRGVSIRYKKNITGLVCDINLDGVVTRIMPTGLREDDTILILPEKYVDSSYINNYPKPKVKEFHFQEIKISDTLTEAQAYELLRQKANGLFSVSKIDIPTSNTKVNFIELSKTEEYKNYSILESIYLYDTVTVKYEPLNIDFKAQTIKYKYDAILKRYIEIELGDFRQNLTSSFTEINKNINDVKNTVENNKSDLQKAIDNATAQLTTALGGYALKRENEFLIMDNPDPMKAVKVWRWNQNGLGYSSTGYNGPYKTAITADGHFVADFIDTGSLSADIIKTGKLTANLIQLGILTSKDNSVQINLENGSFKIGGGTNKAEHTNNYSKFIHDDGTYTQISSDGLKRYKAGSNWEYSYLNYIGSVNFEGKGYYNGTYTVTLPSDFKGRNFKAYFSIGKSWCGGYGTALDNLEISGIVCNQTDGTVTFNHVLTYVDLYTRDCAYTSQVLFTINYHVFV